MSSNTVNYNNGQQLQVNTTLAKLFPFNYEKLQYVYTSAGAITIPAGTVMGVIKATGKVVPVTSAAVDGSAEPIGILSQDINLAGVATINVFIMVQGRVRKDMLLFQGGDTITTVVGEHRYFEWLLRCNILPIVATNGNTYENTLP